MTIGEGIRALLGRHTTFGSLRGVHGAHAEADRSGVPLLAAELAEASEAVLAARLTERTAEVITAALVVIDAADSGQIDRTVTAAYAAISVLQILTGDLGPAAAAGRSVDPDSATAALRARITTAVFEADLKRAIGEAIYDADVAQAVGLDVAQVVSVDE